MADAVYARFRGLSLPGLEAMPSTSGAVTTPVSWDAVLCHLTRWHLPSPSLFQTHSKGHNWAMRSSCGECKTLAETGASAATNRTFQNCLTASAASFACSSLPTSVRELDFVPCSFGPCKIPKKRFSDRRIGRSSRCTEWGGRLDLDQGGVVARRNQRWKKSQTTVEKERRKAENRKEGVNRREKREKRDERRWMDSAPSTISALSWTSPLFHRKIMFTRGYNFTLTVHNWHQTAHHNLVF